MLQKRVFSFAYCNGPSPRFNPGIYTVTEQLVSTDVDFLLNIGAGAVGERTKRIKCGSLNSHHF